jgi:hypothetical protein
MEDKVQGKLTSLMKTLIERDGAQCAWCGKESDLVADHVVPKSEGGIDALQNMQVLCGSCNSQKGNKEESECTKPVRFKTPGWQMGFTSVPNCILLDTELSTNARFAYIGLSYFARQDDEAFPGQGKFEEKLGQSERSFRNARRELEKAGLLETRRRGRGQTNIYILIEPKYGQAAKVASQNDFKPANPADLDRQNMPEHSKKKQVKKTQETDSVSADVQKVYDHFLAVFEPTTPPKLGPSLIRQIEKGLKEYEADALCRAVNGLKQWRQRKPGKETLGAIFDTYPGGKALTEQIAFFISQAKGPTGVGSFPSADRAIVAEKQRLVQRGHRLSTNYDAVQQAKEAELWLRDHGIETVLHPDTVPTFRAITSQNGAGDAEGNR